MKSKREGAGAGVALFCCILLFFFQTLSLFSSDPAKGSLFRLQAAKGTELHIFTAAAETNKSPTRDLLAPENQPLSPFFFKPVAINHCDQELLMTVKGIGPALASRILKARDTVGPFHTPEDLLQVQGIGPVRLQQFSSHLSFGSDFDPH